MGPSLSLWFRCVKIRSLFVRAITEVFFASPLQGWMADNVSSIPQLLPSPLECDIRCGCKQWPSFFPVYNDILHVSFIRTTVP